MTRTMRTLCLTALSIGAGVGIAAATLAVTGGSSSAESHSKQAAALKPVAALTPAQNRQPLNARARQELSRWGARLARCLSTPGIAVGQPRSERTEISFRISIRGSATNDPTVLLTRMTRCDQVLGKPPRGSSVTLDKGAVKKGRGTIRLFKPKTCPLSSSPKGGSK